MASKLLLNTGDALLLNNGDDLLLNDPDVRWLPHFPDWVPPKRSIRTASQRHFIHNVSPIVNPPLPTAMPPMPTFPAQVPSRTTLKPAHRQVTPIMPLRPQSDLYWRGRYPDRFPARRLAEQPDNGFEISSVLDVPITRGWRPRYPDVLRRKLPTPPGQGLWNVDPTTLINAAFCLELGSETFTLPSFSDETSVSSTLSAETFTVPTLAEEDLC